MKTIKIEPQCINIFIQRFTFRIILLEQIWQRSRCMQEIRQNIPTSAFRLIYKRKQLIQMVTQLYKLIVQTAKQLKIKLSTAKLILKKFEQKGTYFVKKCQTTAQPRRKHAEFWKLNTKVKAENQVEIISISSISGCDEAKLQNYKVGHQNNCKQKQVMPTVPYTYYDD